MWAIGPESGGRVLDSARMPDLVLPDFGGQPFDVASLRGRKVLVARVGVLVRLPIRPARVAGAVRGAVARRPRDRDRRARHESRSGTAVRGSRARRRTRRWSTKRSRWSTSSGSRTCRSRCGSTRAASSCARPRSRSRSTRCELQVTEADDQTAAAIAQMPEKQRAVVEGMTKRGRPHRPIHGRDPRLGRQRRRQPVRAVARRSGRALASAAGGVRARRRALRARPAPAPRRVSPSTRSRTSARRTASTRRTGAIRATR